MLGVYGGSFSSSNLIFRFNFAIIDSPGREASFVCLQIGEVGGSERSLPLRGGRSLERVPSSLRYSGKRERLGINEGKMISWHKEETCRVMTKVANDVNL